MTLNRAIRNYQTTADGLRSQSNWSGLPEVLSAAEIWSDTDQGQVELEPNIVVGPYPSVDNYLERHYMLLREDAVAPIRDAVSEVQAYPHMLEKDSREDAFIYERVGI